MTDPTPITDRRGRLATRIGIVLLVGAVVWIASTIFRGSLLPEGSIAPAWELPLGSAAGGTLSSAQLEGKVVVLDFWSTTCPPCLKQMGDLEALYRRMRERGVEVVGVASGGESVERIAGFREDRNVGYPLVVDEGETIAAYAVLSLPTLYIVGRDGRIAFAHRGYLDGPSLSRQVERALAKRVD